MTTAAAVESAYGNVELEFDDDGLMRAPLC